MKYNALDAIVCDSEGIMETENELHGSYQNTITRQWKEIAQRPQSVTLNQSPADPNNMKTGVFLQLFTNSINRALHKQHCTCNGKKYDAQELFEKSNPGLFGPYGANDPSPQVISKENIKSPKQQTDVKLPPVVSKIPTIPNRRSDDVVKEATRSLKRQMKTRGGDNSSVQISPRSKPLGDANVVEPEDELRLPSIMEIRDRHGNNWKIVQEPSKRTRQQQKREKMRSDGKLFRTLSTRKLQLDKEPSQGTHVGGDLVFPETVQKMDADIIEAVSRSNTPLVQVRVPGSEVYADEFDDDESNGQEDYHLPELQPRCQQALTHTYSPQVQTPKNEIPDEMTRKVLLRKWTTLVRTGKMTYSEYLQKVSLMSMLQRSDTVSSKKEMLQSNSQIWSSGTKEKRQRTPSPEDMFANDNVPKRHDAGTNSNFLEPRPSGEQNGTSPSGMITQENSASICSPAFPPELERLYTRTGNRISTLDISQSLSELIPVNFMEQNQQKLRMQYPMYNSKREQEELNMIKRLGSQSLPGNLLSREHPERPMTNEPREIRRKSDFSNASKQKRRSKPRQRVNSRQGNNLIVVTGGRIHVKTETVDEIEAIIELQRQYLEQQTLNDVGVQFPHVYPVPHQPPTTPVDANGTFASVSMPEILAQIAEDAQRAIESEELANILSTSKVDMPTVSERKKENYHEIENKVTGTEIKKTVSGDPIAVVNILPGGDANKTNLLSASFLKQNSDVNAKVTAIQPKNQGCNEGVHSNGKDKGHEACLNGIDETTSLKSEILDDIDDEKDALEDNHHVTQTKRKCSVQTDVKASIKHLEIVNIAKVDGHGTSSSFVSRPVERMMARIPAETQRRRSEQRGKKPQLVGTLPGITATRQVPLKTQQVVFISPALNQGKACK